MDTAPQVDSENVTIHDNHPLINIMSMKETIEISCSCGCLASIIELDTDQVSANSPFCVHVAGFEYRIMRLQEWKQADDEGNSISRSEDWDEDPAEHGFAQFIRTP